MEGGLNSIDVLFTGELTTTKAAELEEREKKGCDLGFATETILASTNTNGGMWLLNGIQEGVGS